MLRTALLFCILALGCAEDNYARLYQSKPKAPSYTEVEIANLQQLGSTLVDQGVNFGVYSEHATRIELLLFVDPEAALPTRQYEMHRFGNVWNIYVEGLGVGQYYGFAAWGPNWPYDENWEPGKIDGFKADVDAAGNRFNPNKLLIDPYARAMHRDHDWSQASLASGPARSESTWAAASKSIVVESKYPWSDNETQWRQNRQDSTWAGHRWNDVIVYEVHLKGFTASTASFVDHPGTYRGFGEKAEYLAQLGITAVELLPVHEKPLDGGYWGYQTLGFFMPELSYATETSKERPAGVIDEFKWMVDELHKHGIEVFLDVVYNHTGEGGFWREKLENSDVSLDPDTAGQLVNFDPKEVAGIYSFRGLDNQAYYALSPDHQSYWNDTGVGNQTRCNHQPMKKLILDSLRYWVEEMHIDGFRFDLAPILGMKDGDYGVWDNQANTVLQDIADDPGLQKYNTRLIAEPWALGYQGFQLGAFPASSNRDDVAWGEWNAHFRDWWRAFVNDVRYEPEEVNYYPLSTTEGPVDGGGSLTGSFSLFGDDGRRPYHATNFLTAHDGFPMYDLFSYDRKSNGCGPLNPVCCHSPTSPFCNRDDGETHNRSRDWGRECNWRGSGDCAAAAAVCAWDSINGTCHAEGFKRQQMRNLFVVLLISHGTPMILGGDEWLRTQLGNNNAYSNGADNPHNWHDWGTWAPYPERQRMVDFVSNMIQLRKDHIAALSPADWGEAAPFSWKGADNADKTDWSNKHLALHYWDSTVGPQLFILINMEEGDVTFQIPDSVTWQRLVDTQAYFDLPQYFETSKVANDASANIDLVAPESLAESTYTVKPRSIVILREQD